MSPQRGRFPDGLATLCRTHARYAHAEVIPGAGTEAELGSRRLRALLPGGRAAPSTHLRHRLPGCGVVLAGVDAVIPPSLHHVQHRLDGDVELGRPLDLQLPGLQLGKS